MKTLALARLLQLGSQALPVGGYSHSQGLESAIEHRWVTDEATVFEWISGGLEFSMHAFDVPCLLASCRAWMRADDAKVTSLNEEFIATRESAELRAATVQMGYSLRSLLSALPQLPPRIIDLLRSLSEPGLPCAWSAASTAWAIEPRDSALAYVWSWVENQVLAAIKLLPLGQSAGQRLLCALGPQVAAGLDQIDLGGTDPGGTDPGGTDRGATRRRSNFTPALAILSARHETQYSRLFRS
jgi:urease accessory protein